MNGYNRLIAISILCSGIFIAGYISNQLPVNAKLIKSNDTIEQMNDNPCETSLSDKEQQLYTLVMEYRKSKGLPDIPVSPSLSFVAQTHVRDLEKHNFSGRCNMHSWSSDGKWSSCCYTSDHTRAKCMWDKPRELTAYTGHGFEISTAVYGASMTPAQALRSWQSSAPHNAVMINHGIWKSHPWKAIGIGMYGKYAVIWFGKEADSCNKPAVDKTLE